MKTPPSIWKLELGRGLACTSPSLMHFSLQLLLLNLRIFGVVCSPSLCPTPPPPQKKSVEVNGFLRVGFVPPDPYAKSSQVSSK